MAEVNGKREAWKLRIIDILLVVAMSSIGLVMKNMNDSANANIEATKVVAVIVQEHGEELASIKANRFTSADGLEVWKEILSIKTLIAGLPTEVPPDWLLQKVNAIEATVTDIDQKLDKHMEKHPP